MRYFIFEAILIPMIFAAFLSGCGTKESNASAAPMQGTEELSWQDVHVDLGKQYGLAAMTEDMIYGCYSENGEIIIAYQNKENGNIEKTESLSTIDYIRNISADSAGNVYIVGGRDDNNILWKIDSTGNFRKAGDFVLEDTDNADYADLQGVYTDLDGNIYLWYEMGIPLTEIFDDAEEDVYGIVDRIYIKNAQLDTLFYEQVADVRGTELLNFNISKRGEALIVARDEEGIYMQNIDVSERQLSDTVYVEGDISPGEITGDIAVTERGFLFCQGSSLYEYDSKNQKAEKILDLTAYGIVPYYTEHSSFDEGLEQLKLDMIKGGAPDIIDVSEIDYKVFADKGVLADLYEFMKNDNDCKADDIMESVAGAYEMNGHFYSIAPSFQLYSIWGSNSVIKDRSGVTLGELIRVLEESGKSLDAIYGFSADEPVMTTLCTFGMDEFVDWEQHTCNFDGEYFKEIVSFAEEYKGSYTEGSQSEGINSGKIVMSAGIIGSVGDYQAQSKLYKDDIAFIGYPTNNGSGTGISFRGSELAINNHGENKEEAWEFVKYYLMNGYAGQGFPTVKTQFEAAMQEAMTSCFYEGEDGQKYEAVKGSYIDEDIELLVYAANQDDVDAVRKLIDSAVPSGLIT